MTVGLRWAAWLAFLGLAIWKSQSVSFSGLEFLALAVAIGISIFCVAKPLGGGSNPTVRFRCPQVPPGRHCWNTSTRPSPPTARRSSSARHTGARWFFRNSECSPANTASDCPQRPTRNSSAAAWRVAASKSTNPPTRAAVHRSTEAVAALRKSLGATARWMGATAVQISRASMGRR